MLEKVPTILRSQEILDKAFLKANKIAVPDPDKYHRVRKTEEAQMECISEVCREALRKFHKSFPTLETLPEYEQEVLEVLVGLDALRQALGRVDGAAYTCGEIYGESKAKMRRERTIEGIKRVKRSHSGRIASVLKDVDPALAFLAKTREAVRLLPSIHPGFATVVIAGFPNVGKSSLLAAWTDAKPEIASYAFTTKAANVGHFVIPGAAGRDVKVQVVDTPGLLDRQDKERNAVEKQAVAALRHAADAVLFLLDPTDDSGYTMEEQEHLLLQVQKEMAGVPLVEAETKSDVKKTRSKRLKFSAVSGEGLEELKKAIVALMPHEGIETDDPLRRWSEPGAGIPDLMRDPPKTSRKRTS